MAVSASLSSLQLSAELFATVALRSDAVASFVMGTELAVVKPDSAGAGTILYASEVGETLRTDYSEDVVRSFLRDLAAGRLDQARYEASNGSFAPGLKSSERLTVNLADILGRQDPVSPALRRPATEPDPEVRLTVPGVFLENLPRIPKELFDEAVFRALGDCEPVEMDLIWLHARLGEVRRHFVTAPVVLSAIPPEAPSVTDYRATPLRFPLICLEFDNGSWILETRQVIGRPETRDRIVDALGKTPWGLRIRRPHAPGTAKSSPKSPTPKAPQISKAPPKAEPDPAPPPPPPPVEDLRSVAEIFFRPGHEHLLKGRQGIIGITKPEIPLDRLPSIPKTYFDRAVRWCLGVRDPREGDRVAFTAGQGFSRKGKLRDCLFVCHEIPRSRSDTAYPKVWMEYRGGRWTILPHEARGKGAEELIQAVLELRDWGLTEA